jgi:hypothetical protein
MKGARGKGEGAAAAAPDVTLPVQSETGRQEGEEKPDGPTGWRAVEINRIGGPM